MNVEERNNSAIEVKESTTTFETVYNSDYAPNDPSLKAANLVLIPYHNYRPDIEYCFGEYSEEFLRYVREKGSEEIRPDIAITDEQYQSMEMHSLLIDIGIFIATNVILSLAVNILSNYVYDKVKSMHEKKENVSVRVEIITQDANGNSKSIKYDGPVSGFDAVKNAANDMLK